MNTESTQLNNASGEACPGATALKRHVMFCPKAVVAVSPDGNARFFKGMNEAERRMNVSKARLRRHICYRDPMVYHGFQWYFTDDYNRILNSSGKESLKFNPKLYKMDEHVEYTPDKKYRKPIVAVRPDGTARVFDSVAQARREIGVFSGTLRKHLTTRHMPTYLGFQWYYKDDYQRKVNTEGTASLCFDERLCRRAKAVVAVRPDGEVAGRFDSVADAVRLCGNRHEPTLRRHINKRLPRTYLRLQWYYEDDYRRQWMDEGPESFRFETDTRRDFHTGEFVKKKDGGVYFMDRFKKDDPERYAQMHGDLVKAAKEKWENGTFERVCRKVKCLTDGREFGSICAAAKHYGIAPSYLNEIVNRSGVFHPGQPDELRFEVGANRRHRKSRTEA